MRSDYTAGGDVMYTPTPKWHTSRRAACHETLVTATPETAPSHCDPTIHGMSGQDLRQGDKRTVILVSPPHTGADDVIHCSVYIDLLPSTSRR
ncbi:hypothetical protein J6590_073074 [Homalodisca vitripennis]|nr:hypothetical protein J6590_073074 [Homalodisca vitripennis]